MLPSARRERIDLRRPVDAEIQRHAVHGRIARSQPLEPFGIRIARGKSRLLRVGVLDEPAGRRHDVLVAQRGGLQHVDGRLKPRMRQPYAGPA